VTRGPAVPGWRPGTGSGTLPAVVRSALPRSRSAPAAALLVVWVVLLAWWFAATPASAHASLVEADPADRSWQETAPDEVTLVFNEPVSLAPEGLRVFDGDARRVDLGDRQDPSTPDRIHAALPDDLPDGGYVVTYRVISADSHPVAGALTFTVGDGVEVADELVAELFGGAGAHWPGLVGPVLRALAYLGALVAAGAVVFAAGVASSPRDRRSARWLASRAIVLAGGASLAAVPVQAVAVTGRRLLDVVRPGGGLGETLLATSFGHGTLVRVAGLSALWLAWSSVVKDRRDRPAQHVATGAAAVVVAGSFVLDGHQRTVEPTWLLAGADLVHLLGAATWLGVLALLAVAVRRRRLDDDPVGAARIVARASRVALWSVVAVGAAGVAMAWVLVRTPSALTSTGYGWTLVAKTGVVVLVLAFAAYNRWRLVPAVTARMVPAGGAVDTSSDDAPAAADDPASRSTSRSAAAWRQLRTTTLIEVIGLAVVLSLTGFLVTQRPAAEAAGITGAFEATVDLTDQLELDLVVDPNRAGRNAVHVYVLDPTGRPSGDVDDLRLELTFVPEGIGPFPLEPFLVGPGHWTATIDELAFPGTWEVRVVAGIDRFTEATATIEVEVQP
jgi:copper transport protein